MKKQLIFTTFLFCVLILTIFTALMPVQVNGALVDAKILSYSWYVAETNNAAEYIGDLVVVGELQNVGTTNMYYVYVVGSAYVNDVEVGRVSRQAFGNNMPPGQKAPFYIDFVPQCILIDDIDAFSWENVTNVVVTVGYIADTDKSMYQDLTVSSEGYFPDVGSSPNMYTVIGAVKNIGAEIAGNVRVMTTFYNTAGTVVSLNYTDILSDSFSPGLSKNFIATPIDIYPGIDDIVSYATLVQSTIQHPEDADASNSSNTKTPSTSSYVPHIQPLQHHLNHLNYSQL